MLKTTIEIYLKPGWFNSMKIVFPDTGGWVAVGTKSGLALLYLVAKLGTRVKKNVFETTDPELIEIGKKLVTATRHAKNRIIFESIRQVIKRENSPGPVNATLYVGRPIGINIDLVDNNRVLGGVMLRRGQGLMNLLTFLGKESTLCGITPGLDNTLKLNVNPAAMTKLLVATKFQTRSICRAFDPDTPNGYELGVKGVEKAKERERLIKAKERALISGKTMTTQTRFGSITITVKKSRQWRRHRPIYDIYLTLEGTTIKVIKISKNHYPRFFITRLLKSGFLASRDLPTLMRGVYKVKNPTTAVSTERLGDLTWDDVATAITNNIPLTVMLSLK